MPLKVSGITFQSGAPQGRGQQNDDPDRDAEHGNDVEQRREFQIGGDVGGECGDENGGDDEDPRRRSSGPSADLLTMGE